eukprot:CAMPEP_0183353100 /NCGR_PEP_ID=MMETSP0164_2-20130417/32747_1 /TAXON_ID=221442 /ORGANISM="Coccolithus pelagicus ssp braarudi, Strain PLY182g" /LENGTH=85 /DNA_ID=CAMNT_0025525719 /DNA_START=23 /DNA_END=280 /DNA_ORIENTATION=+
MVSSRPSRAAQLREVFRVDKFPVMTWALAGSCLVILYFVDMPNRMAQRQAAEKADRLAMHGKDVAQVLANGRVLLSDGSVVRKEP